MPFLCASHSMTILPQKVAHKRPVQVAGQILSSEAVRLSSVGRQSFRAGVEKRVFIMR